MIIFRLISLNNKAFFINYSSFSYKQNQLWNHVTSFILIICVLSYNLHLYFYIIILFPYCSLICFVKGVLGKFQWKINIINFSCTLQTRISLIYTYIKQFIYFLILLITSALLIRTIRKFQFCYKKIIFQKKLLFFFLDFLKSFSWLMNMIYNIYMMF